MPKRVDENQKEIVEVLRRAGYSVVDTHEIGKGYPDLTCGRGGVTYLLEVKQPGKQLNEREREWHAAWRGHVAIVHSAEEALKILESER